MGILLVSAITLLVTGLWAWLPKYRLREAIRAPFPDRFVAILETNVPVYSKMTVELQQQLQHLIKQFLHQKTFYGCGGLAINDEIKVTIAGIACLLLLNRKSHVYPQLTSVLVYPSAFVAPRTEIEPGGVVTYHEEGLLGESWGDGRVVLAWDEVKEDASDFSDGHNVVLHEFAHQLDDETGSADGVPILGKRASYQSWAAVFSREYAALQSSAFHRDETFLDPYGATNPAEFFAVVTETFFEMPVELAEHHPELFGELESYYRVDPRAWQ
ncbi:zinc-dependent peptidase [Candidimonas sp. SYP-B2681]|uniref:M90 family metallopeptidase n=1 Tax=Candidimonas sp. SYP-B2681 TaxID=2497686 RepID=UPI000F88F5AC|nr:M90 family metallopeptidase [Candidimonas sp. SYP-B2681]RTZ48113.1 zinc-dependent peptidase [Candidimonas sp. SYP-B2681]